MFIACAICKTAVGYLYFGKISIGTYGKEQKIF